MTFFFVMLFVHLIGDFYTQKQSWIECKIANKHRSLGLFKHICVHLVLTSLVVTFFTNLSLLTSVSVIAVIVVSHYLIDIWKTYQEFTLFSFVADQLAHIIVILMVSLWLAGILPNQTWAYVISLVKLDYLQFVVIYLLAFKPVSLLMYLLLRNYTSHLNQSNSASGGLENAGEYIGFLERGLIISFVLLDSLASVGFLLAAKSVFRFGDMRRESDRKLTEYIMLGTLCSFSFALLLGHIAKFLLS
jgi:hypothetical protein